MRADERETLGLGLARGHSLRMMSRVLGRAPGTVSRESARNATRGRHYRTSTAQTQAAARARQPRRPCKLREPWLWQYVREHLAEGCGRLRRVYPDDLQKHLSAKTISVALYVLSRGTLRIELLAALRQARRARGTDRRGQIPICRRSSIAPPRWPPIR
ncbi:MAG: helix-turn-helix domain-containing protein [Nitrospirota bacterium]